MLISTNSEFDFITTHRPNVTLPNLLKSNKTLIKHNPETIKNNL
jgi:hypothetical protein